MLAFITQNLGTILVGAALLAAVAGICVHLIRAKKNAQSAGCGCGCGGCPGAPYCHKN